MSNQEQKQELVKGMVYVPEGEEMSEENVYTKGMVYEEKEPEKTYLILLFGENRDNEASEFKDWEIVTGRQDAYDYIKRYVESEYVYIDVHKSYIISNSANITIDKKISIFKFMVTMKENDVIKDDTSFDIHEYAYGDEKENGDGND